LAYAYKKVNATVKEREKGFLKLLSGREVLRKCAKSNAGRKNKKGINFVN
jgi:hypothetical protein